MFDEEEGLHRILEGAEFDVDEMMDSPSLIKDNGLQERTGVVKASKLNAFRTGGWQPLRGAHGNCEEEALPRNLLYLFAL